MGHGTNNYNYKVSTLVCNSFNKNVSTDIDECSMLNYNNCSSNATCNNTGGSFQCTCNSGYTGNGTFCEGQLNEKIT
jgi:hypothetical protein